jgi:hypothetical protein
MIPAQNLPQRLADGPQIEFVDLPGGCALRSDRRLINLRAQRVFASARRSDIHEEASVKTKEQDEYGTAQTSIRHHPRTRSAMREYAVAPIHTSGVALRHVGPRDAT